jgi:hypothetical protein
VSSWTIYRSLLKTTEPRREISSTGLIAVPVRVAWLATAGLQHPLDRPTEPVGRCAVPGARVHVSGTNVKHYRFNFVPAAARRLGLGVAVKVSFFCWASKLGVIPKRRFGLP